MGPKISYSGGQTPLDEDEIHGLLIPGITSRGELDEFEHQNIERAVQWSMTKTFSPNLLLGESFVRELHERMFGDVWAWAGSFRKTEKNIGVAHHLVPSLLRQLLEDARYWMEHQTYPPDETVIRIKHRLVSIHCFSNGNGRHSRLFADMLAENIFKRAPFTWGAATAGASRVTRDNYFHALKSADAGIIQPLLAFARS